MTAVPDRVGDALRLYPHVLAVDLVGSRATGENVPLSDWDFLITTDDEAVVAVALPDLVTPLEPMSSQWDRLGPPEYSCYMLMLAGPAKVDLILPNLPHEPEPPWLVSAATLTGIDQHFWDWIVWMASKEQHGQVELVRLELAKLHTHLLAPMGVTREPATIADALGDYLTARTEAERRFGVLVPRELEAACRPALPA